MWPDGILLHGPVNLQLRLAREQAERQLSRLVSVHLNVLRLLHHVPILPAHRASGSDELIEGRAGLPRLHRLLDGDSPYAHFP